MIHMTNNKKYSHKKYESRNSILLTEPRIEAIRREIQALLEVVDLEVDGKPVTIDGFRLKDNSHWADYPTSLSDIFWHLSSVCNFSCEFCYEKGNPPDFPIQNTFRMATPEEIQTRLKYYDPSSGSGIFTVRTAINEPFANRHAVEYLKIMREESPKELISFVTNGSYLTEDVVIAIKELQPIFFNLSIYSTDPAIRKSVLHDHRPDRAIMAVDLLEKHQVPYMANLVMWPSIPFDDMEKTIAYMSDKRAVLLRVCLGGYSKYLKDNERHFDIADYWPTVVMAVDKIRGKYSIPILIEPNSYVRTTTDAYIDGVIQGSPAQKAGLQRDDQILAVNGQWIGSRMQLLSELRRNAESDTQVHQAPGVTGMTNHIQDNEDEGVVLRVARGKEILKVSLERYEQESMKSYPYSQIASFSDFMYGLIITDSLRYSSLRFALMTIEKVNAQKVLLLTSLLIEPILKGMLAKTNAFDNREIFIRIAKNNYFGGTINLGDLLVVQDFIEAIQEFLEVECADIDLVLIPASSFASSPWGRDLTGRPWRDIERTVGVKVDLIPCSNITF